jgi:hypothetical protein
MYSRSTQRSQTTGLSRPAPLPPVLPGFVAIDGMRALAQIVLLKSQTTATD